MAGNYGDQGFREKVRDERRADVMNFNNTNRQSNFMESESHSETILRMQRPSETNATGDNVPDLSGNLPMIRMNYHPVTFVDPEAVLTVKCADRRLWASIIINGKHCFAVGCTGSDAGIGLVVARLHRDRVCTRYPAVYGSLIRFSKVERNR